MLSRLERGEFELNIRREQLEEVTREFRHTANRLSMALIVDASVVALSVVMGVRDGGQIRQ